MDAKDEHIAKVAIKIKDAKELISLDKTKTLRENVAEICCKYSIAAPDSYGLKLLAKSLQDEGTYVQEATFQSITNGSELELVPSVEAMIQMIFQKSLRMPLNFAEFDKLKTDPVFLETIVRFKYDEEIQRVVEEENLNYSELSTCLITLLQLLKTRQINTIRKKVLLKVIELVKSIKSKSPVLQHLIAMLNQVLYMKRTSNIREYQQKIIDELPISHLMKLCENSTESLQINVIKLVNTIVKCVKEERRPEMVKELRKQRDCIFAYVIKERKTVSQAMAFELYVYQSFLLRDKYKASLDLKIDTSNDMMKTFDEFDDELRRNSDLLDFEEGLNRNRSGSTDTIIEKFGSRYSLASTRHSTASTLKSMSSYSQFSSDENDSICYRTYENLSHYKNEHRGNYSQSHVEENAYKPGIIVTADRVTKMLSKILQIDSRISKSAHNYHPLVFNTTLCHDDFFAELFCRTMWLLSKTRREMKAYIYEDFEKVLKVLECQIRMVLDKKPTDMKELLEYMKDVNAKTVYDQWQKDRESDWKYIYENNQSVQELKVAFNDANAKLIFEQRMALLKSGAAFPKLPEKKSKQQQYFYFSLSDNLKVVHKFEYDEQMGKTKELENFEVAKIRHVIIGRNCPHYKDNTVKQEKLIFSFQLEGDVHQNFLAKDETTANYWIDGFNLLLGKDYRSRDYDKDLNILTEMDCALQLLDLQDTHLFSRPAPPIPPLPPKPSIPPKGAYLMKRINNVQK